jgi:hypothetical protein
MSAMATILTIFSIYWRADAFLIKKEKSGAQLFLYIFPL